MSRNQKIENITNSLNAASKIKAIQKSSTRSGSDNSIFPINPDMLSEILKIIASHSPNTFRGPLGETCERCDTYINTYRKLKQHLYSTKKQKLNMDKFVKSLQIMHPVLGSNEKLMVEKILKIYEIFEK